MDFVTDVLFEGACSLIVTVEDFTLNDVKLEILLVMLKWGLDFLKRIEKMFSILYRHVEKPKFISHQGRKTCSTYNIDLCTIQSLCTVNIIWQINYISSNECHSFICFLLQTT